MLGSLSHDESCTPQFDGLIETRARSATIDTEEDILGSCANHPLVNAQVPVVSNHLGHADPSIPLRVYALSVIDGMAATAMDNPVLATQSEDGLWSV